MTRMSYLEAFAKAAAEAVPRGLFDVDDLPRPLGHEESIRTPAVLSVPPPPSGWPVLQEDHALAGLAGCVVRTIEPHSESDPAAILLDFLASFGNAVGPAPHMLADSAEHTARLNVVLVGETSRARKGSSRTNVRRVMRAADEEWTDLCNGSGLASGEGLIRHLADQQDKRLLVTESEFSRVLKVTGRNGNILSQLIRQAWDGDPLQNMTKNDPLTVDRSHVSLLAHITAEELHRAFNDTEAANGFGNRFLWGCVRRSKKLPNGGSLSQSEVSDIGGRIRATLSESRKVGRMKRSPQAAMLWEVMYDQIEDEAGLVGAISARAEAQILRLSIIYGLLDGVGTIGSQHLLSAKSVWDYCHNSVRYIFGHVSGDPIKDALLDALEDAGSAGLTFTEQRDLFSRHQSARVAASRRQLEAERRIETITETTGGRPRRRSYLLAT